MCGRQGVKRCATQTWRCLAAALRSFASAQDDKRGVAEFADFALRAAQGNLHYAEIVSRVGSGRSRAPWASTCCSITSIAAPSASTKADTAGDKPCSLARSWICVTEKFSSPQGLKPRVLRHFFGTAEAVPSRRNLERFAVPAGCFRFGTAHPSASLRASKGSE